MQVELAPDVVCEPWPERLKRHTGEPYERLKLPPGQPPAILSALSLDEKRVAVCRHWRDVDLYDVETNRVLKSTFITTGDVALLAFAEHVLVLVLHSIQEYRVLNDTVIVLDARTLEKRNEFTLGGAVYDVAVSRDGLILATRTLKDVLILRSAVDGTVFHVERGESFAEDEVSLLEIEDEPGRSDGVVHVAVGCAWRMTRVPRLQILAVLCAPTLSTVFERFVRRDGDHAVLSRVLGWAL